MRDTVYRLLYRISPSNPYGYLGSQNFNNHDNYVTVYRILHTGFKNFIFQKFMFTLVLFQVAGFGYSLIQVCSISRVIVFSLNH